MNKMAIQTEMPFCIMFIRQAKGRNQRKTLNY